MNKKHNPDSTCTNNGQLWSVEQDQVGQRLDRYLMSVLKTISRTGIQQLIVDGSIQVNGRTSKPGYALKIHDEVRVLQVVPASQPKDIKPQTFPLDIVYEDDDLLIVNKVAGMVVHPAAGHYEDTLVNALLARYPQFQEFGSQMRPGIVHRLDKDTSGLLIVAKNVQTQAALVEQMKRHEVTKRYLALVEGVISLDKGSIDAPIGRDLRHREQMAITTRQSREARTHFKVLKRFAHHTLLLLQLETGRTHQIRVHLQAIGHPIVGDPVYGAKNSGRGITLQRQFLHAYQLGFIHPTTGKTLEFEAPLPDDLQAVLDQETLLL